ncbi:MAG: Asp-tRNA(Asn)/Glu-tRNA(Gln) amidotransferase subunit GatB [Fimbriiglobus sp.]|jgi:aspartyl-tRNA(Asn)/glutamyl-tRNA(Gln) amidotransferase subunit B|nr:Asp-tRNA(Asn)/Glu-tRNA(Gln) amidotransferase subunit GatB [Fimbriiglobus sp.]
MPDLPYKIVVGLEVHVQLLTKTKLFCGCKNQFGQPPNTATCPVCLGLPGALPVMNKQAFHLALKAALALNCQIATHNGYAPGFTKWDRKNYYYPDLPKNFQISQFDLPFSHDGFLDINVHPDPKKGHTAKRIGIIRAHLEEDAGKNIHDESGRGGDTRVDLNRTGTPLLEIVSHPHMNSPEEAIAYLDELRLMLRELKVSDCEMQEGSLRCDANVNIHIPKADEPKGYAATPLVEIKNLNSFRGVGKAIAYEAESQYEQFQRDPANFRFGKMLKTTAGWDDARGKTIVQRRKEEAADYRYFPEPDLVPVVVSAEQIEAVKADMGELPQAQRARLEKEYGLTPYDAEVLTAKGRTMVAYFETVAKATGDGKAAANRLSDLIYPALAERNEEIDAFPMKADAFADFLKGTASLTKMDRTAVLNVMLEKGGTLEEAKKIVGIKEFDESALRAAVVEAISKNPRAVADFKAGKDQAKMSIVGAVMKANKGAPNDVVRRLVDEELAKG